VGAASHSPARGQLLAAVVLLSTITGAACAWFKPSLGADEVDCARAAVREETAKLLPEVTLLLSGAVDPGAALLALEQAGVQSGGDALACAVATVVRDFQPGGVAVPDAGTALVASDALVAAAMMPDDAAAQLVARRALAVKRGTAFLDGKKRARF
jgi:hypothetical protein